jgi:hypothetical protein
MRGMPERCSRRQFGPGAMRALLRRPLSTLFGKGIHPRRNSIPAKML